MFAAPCCCVCFKNSWYKYGRLLCMHCLPLQIVLIDKLHLLCFCSNFLFTIRKINQNSFCLRSLVLIFFLHTLLYLLAYLKLNLDFQSLTFTFPPLSMTILLKILFDVFAIMCLMNRPPFIDIHSFSSIS